MCSNSEQGLVRPRSSDLEAPRPSLPPGELPPIHNLNVTNSSRFHLGPKNITITQNNVVRGRLLCLELVSPNQARRLRCSVAVFVCWALVVAAGLAICLLFLTVNRQFRLDIGLNETWYLRRPDWQARSELSMTLLTTPVKIVAIGHTDTPYCDQRFACVREVLAIQQLHVMGRRWDDIGPNFLVAGKGLIYEGRGANIVGTAVRSWNSKIISILFIGDYRKDDIDQEQIEHLKVLLDVLVKKEVLAPDYELYGNCQLDPYTIPPGPNIMDNLHLFSHWNSANAKKCLRHGPVTVLLYITEFEAQGTLSADLPLWQYLYNVVKNTTRAERISCVAAVLLVLVCNVLIIYFTLFAKKPSPPDAEVDWLVPREEWLAKPYNYTVFHGYPVPLVVVQHTVSAECTDFITCAAEMRFLQDMYLNPVEYGYDIPYNFLIGNDGRVYVGRDWDVVGAHTLGYNSCSIGIAFTGDYRTEEEGRVGGSRVSTLQLTNMLRILEQGVRRGALHPRYRIVAASDVAITASPGGNLHQALSKLANYGHEQFRYKNCTVINAMPQFSDDSSRNFTTDSTQVTESQTESVM